MWPPWLWRTVVSMQYLSMQYQESGNADCLCCQAGGWCSKRRKVRKVLLLQVGEVDDSVRPGEGTNAAGCVGPQRILPTLAD